MGVLISIIYIVFPALTITACLKWPSLNKLGIVIICYIGGILLGNFPLFPENMTELQESFSGISVSLALPLLLCSLNVRRWLKDLAGRALLSMGLEIVSVTIITLLLTLYFRNSLPDTWQLAAMGISVYTGGTPNLAAIKTALNIDSDTFIIFHTYDTLFSFLFIIFVVTIGQRVFNLFLPSFQIATKDNGTSQENHSENIAHYRELFQSGTRSSLALAGFMSIVIFVVSYGFSCFLPESMQTTTIILLITTFGIILSFIPKIHKTPNTFFLGMYLIYIFCVVVGSMTNLEKLIAINYGFFVYVFIAIFGTMFLHSLLCRIFSVDTDTFLITSTAAICSPPFVPVVADALKNPRILLSGMTTGIIGYAAGNYLGIFIGLLLKYLLFRATD